MEIESRSDSLTVTYAKPRAEALLAVAEYGLRLITAMGTIQRTAPMENALQSVDNQIRLSRGKSVTLTLSRGDASLFEKAIVVGHQGAEAGDPAVPAMTELGALQHALWTLRSARAPSGVCCATVATKRYPRPGAFETYEPPEPTPSRARRIAEIWTRRFASST
jgi:hypothetical protein